MPLEAVTVISGDTAMVPYGGGTWASRGMPSGGSATLLAVRALRDRVRRAATYVDKLKGNRGDWRIRVGDYRKTAAELPQRSKPARKYLKEWCPRGDSNTRHAV